MNKTLIIFMNNDTVLKLGKFWNINKDTHI